MGEGETELGYNCVSLLETGLDVALVKDERSKSCHYLARMFLNSLIIALL